MQSVQATRPTSLWSKRIPTLFGVGILVVGLIVGVVFIGQGAGVFAPRASAETTPKNVKITNVSEGIFTVSFLTDAPTPAFVKYSTDETKLSLQQPDDRDQLSGNIGEYTSHHITIRGLQPATVYYFVIGTGSGALFDNNGTIFKITTAKKAGAPAAAKTIYGSVTTQSGAPADGSIVYIKIPGAYEQSSLVKASGSWAVPLSGARTADGSAYAAVTDETELQITAQGSQVGDVQSLNVQVKNAQPVATIAFGKPIVQAQAPVASPSPSPTSQPATVPTPAPTPLPTPSPASAGGAPRNSTNALTDLANATPSAQATPSASPTASQTEVTTVDLEVAEQTKQAPTVTTSQPVITGQAIPNVTVKIEVHSENQIYQQVVTDDQGNFVLDLASIKAQLEPGEHTVTYSYIDPTTGKQVTKSQTFTVSAEEPQATNQPYGSGNPVPIGTATQSATATSSAQTATASATASSSAKPASNSARVSTASTSGTPVSGAIGATLALIFGGLFFIISGVWSFWASREFSEVRAPSRISKD